MPARGPLRGPTWPAGRPQELSCGHGRGLAPDLAQRTLVPVIRTAGRWVDSLACGPGLDEHPRRFDDPQETSHDRNRTRPYNKAQPPPPACAYFNAYLLNATFESPEGEHRAALGGGESIAKAIQRPSGELPRSIDSMLMHLRSRLSTGPARAAPEYSQHATRPAHGTGPRHQHQLLLLANDPERAERERLEVGVGPAVTASASARSRSRIAARPSSRVAVGEGHPAPVPARHIEEATLFEAGPTASRSPRSARAAARSTP